MNERRKSVYCHDCGCYIPVGDEDCPACGKSIHPPTCMLFFYDTTTIANADFYIRGGRGNPVVMAYYQGKPIENMSQVSEEQEQILMNKTIIDNLQYVNLPKR